MEPVSFNTLENAQNIKKIVRIFSKNKSEKNLKPHNNPNEPTLVVLVGAPGVGKTTKAKKFLNEQGLNYDNFYNVSVDSLLEHVKPYRNVTKELYNEIKTKKNKEKGSNSKLNDKNYATLFQVFIPMLMSKQPNFSLNSTKRHILENIHKKENNNTSKATAKKTAKKSDGPKLKNLLELRLEGLKYGIEHGFNILYDTTFNSRTNIIERDIIPILKANKQYKYNIKVILVTAPVENIKNRIRGRHKAMLEEKEPYIRAINVTTINSLVEENKIGFEKAKEYFEKSKKNFNNFIKSSEFIEVENPTYTNKNKNK